MAKIYKYLPSNKYSKIENEIFRIKKNKLSDGAKVMYGFIVGFKSGRNINDSYILKSLEISAVSLKKYKKELKELDLIHIERINRTSYNMYVGHLQFPATKVFEYWDELNKDEGRPLTLKDIENMRRVK